MFLEIIKKPWKFFWSCLDKIVLPPSFIYFMLMKLREGRGQEMGQPTQKET
jgi:hypothetical protein